MKARYLINDPLGDGAWIDMPEAEPRTRARLKAGEQPLILVIEDDGQVSGELDRVDLDTTYEG